MSLVAKQFFHNIENGTRFHSKNKEFLNITTSGTILILFIYIHVTNFINSGRDNCIV